MATPRRRPIVRLGHETTALITLGLLGGLLASLALAGQFAAALTGAGWPSWRDVGVNLLAPVVAALAQPDAPMRSWPGLAEQEIPPAWLYWTVAGSLAALITSALVAAARLLRSPTPGFASRREVSTRLGAQTLLKQAARLRPELAKTTSRPRPEQLGARLGRDVHTGVDCYSSVRQSRYVLGPSESGKTSAVVIPEALDHDGPLLAPSSRADVLAATWLARSEQGRIQLFDPLRQAPALPLVQWDPVRACVDPTVAIRRAQALMASIDMSKVSNGDAWKNRGQAVLRNLLHAAALDHKDIRTVLRWAYDQTCAEPAALLDRADTSWAEMQHAVINTPERQRAGYYMAVEAAMETFTHPAVLATCTPEPGQDFDARAFLDGHNTLYLLAERTQAVAVSDLLSALMEEILFHARRHAQRCANNRLDPALRLLVDEAPTTVTLPQLPDLLADGGGRGIPTTIVVQDRAQAVHRWGREAADSMWGAATVRMVLPGVAGNDEMREIAAYFDDYDEEITSSTTGNHGHSTQRSLRPRAAMTTAGVRAIPAFHSLVVAAGGLKPVLTRLQPYFHRPDAARSARSEREFYAALDDGTTVL
ncbi:type IV secretory system conjugative DNA transfer family protein [Actinokineospora sp. NPDC004072]